MAEEGFTRGQVLGFTGLIAGAAGGYKLGQLLKSDTAEAVGLIAGALAGTLGAHWVNTRPLARLLGPEKGAASGIGEVPPPYRELYPPWWILEGRPASRGEELHEPWWPVISRTVLVPAFVRSTWGTGREWQYAGAANCSWELYGHFPRYTLYGGPMRRDAFPGVKGQLESWASGNRNLLGDGSPSYHACVTEVPIGLPETAVPFRWTWVWETYSPSRWQLVQPSPVASGRWERRPGIGA